MKQKDLAEEYATARLHGRLSGNEVMEIVGNVTDNPELIK